MSYFSYLIQVSIRCPRFLEFVGIENNKAKFIITFLEGMSNYMKDYILRELFV